MKVLTIIIPSYNTEKFIEKNMKTFIDERLFENTEVILINDGSRDNTATIAEEYEKKYPGYVRFINKENGGHGSVINCGIKEATGKYFKVIDADDWVDTEGLVKLTEDLCNCNADMVINPYIKIDQNTGNTLLCGEVKYINDKALVFKDLINLNYRLALHSITIKTSILRDNEIRMTEKCFYEDFEYTFYPIPYIKSVAIMDYPIYFYLVGQKTQSVNASSGLKNMPMYIKVMEDSIGYYRNVETTLSTDIADYMKGCLSDYIRSMYNIYLRNKSTKDIYSKMMISDEKLKDISMPFYREVGKRNAYIEMLRRGGYMTYVCLSIAFKIYKSREIS